MATASLKDKIVYPQDGTELDFYAYYPYSRDAINPESIPVGVKPDQGLLREGMARIGWLPRTRQE